MTDTQVRTRMAPSPTGEFHIGSMRTLMYAYAFAKHNNGKFVLRIEDTDQNRLVEGAVERLMDVVNDYGFTWDEGPKVEGDYGPYVQSKRLEIYKKYVQQLIDNGTAYYCFCTKERLADLRKEQQAAHMPTTKYDKHCLNLSKEEIQKNLDNGVPYVVRLNVPKDENITFTDEILGELSFPSNDIDDQVLMKSDGFPTYHLAVVIDDHLMGISHVMRGFEWLPSTPKHVLLYKAFGWDLPKYVHLPLLKEKGSNSKMSKRHGSVSAIAFLEEGYVPEALNNFLMFLGWNPGTEKEIYTLEEFVKDFSLDGIQKTDLVTFDRDKLLWVNGVYLREMSNEELLQRVKNWSKKFNLKLNIGSDDEYNLQVVGLIKIRIKKFSEFNELTKYFYETPNPEEELLHKFSKSKEKTSEILSNYLEVYKNIEESNWDAMYLDKISHDLLEKYDYKPKEAFMTLRVALSGVKSTPPLFDVMSVLGKDASIKRIENSI